MHPAAAINPYQPFANITILTRAFARNTFAWTLFLGCFDELTVGALWNVPLPHQGTPRIERNRPVSFVICSVTPANLKLAMVYLYSARVARKWRVDCLSIRLQIARRSSPQTQTGTRRKPLFMPLGSATSAAHRKTKKTLRATNRRV
jgi:hypothetical protein